MEGERSSLVEKLSRIDGLREKLQRDLVAIDHTLGLHEISIEPTDIAPVVPHRRRSLFPSGELTRTLLHILRTNDDWLSTSEITTHVVEKLSAGTGAVDLPYVHHAVRRRLRTMLQRNLIQRDLAVGQAGKHDGISHTLWKIR